MSFRLNAAITAALALSAATAVTASDMSIAGEAINHASLLKESPEPAMVPATGDKPVIFAKSREVVQPLNAIATAAKTAANSIEDSDLLENKQDSAASLTALVDAQGAAETLEGEMQCLAGGVYFESKGESLEGQLAVARVIINRAKSGRFASSLCGVIYQRGQFSFVRGGSMPNIAQSSRGWREAVAIAQIAMDQSWDSRAEGALFFHARRVSPGWGKARLALIDNHVFYR